MLGQPGAVVAGKFRLEKLIGEGGMGHVWRAWDTSLQRAVAIKFISEEAAKEERSRKRFLAEARAAAKLRTPHVVQIIEQGIEEGSPFIVMELLEGEDLHKRLKRRKRLTPAEICDIVRQLARGLRAAHEAGVIHRDLKPANVFLARVDDETETVKILDFGIAKLHQEGELSQLTATNEMVGSVHYMSPEQIREQKDYDHRVDLWALGVIVFRSLTGQLPFVGDSLGAVAVDICTGPLPKALDLRPELPEAIDEFFTQALAKNPDERFSSARAFSRALDAVCHEEGAPTGERFLSTPPSGPAFPALELPPISERGTDDGASQLDSIPAPPSARRRRGFAKRLILSSAPPASSYPPRSSEPAPLSQPPPSSPAPPSSGRPDRDEPSVPDNSLSAPPPASGRRRAALAERMVSSAPPPDSGPIARPPPIERTPSSTPSPRHAVTSRPRARVHEDATAPGHEALRAAGFSVAILVVVTVLGIAASASEGRPALALAVGYGLGGLAGLAAGLRMWSRRSDLGTTVAAAGSFALGAGALLLAAARTVPALSAATPTLGPLTRLAAAVVSLGLAIHGGSETSAHLGRGQGRIALGFALIGLVGLAAAYQLGKKPVLGWLAAGPAAVQRFRSPSSPSCSSSPPSPTSSLAMVAPQPPRWAGASPKSRTRG